MVKMEKFDEWLKEITPFGNVEDYIKVIFDMEQGESHDYEFKKQIVLYTRDYKYTITAIDGIKNDGYLGCVYSLRKPLPGENWTRGRDLPNGNFNKNTWEKIILSMIKNELMMLTKKIESKVCEEKCVC